MTTQRKHLTMAALGAILGVASTSAGAGWAASAYLSRLATKDDIATLAKVDDEARQSIQDTRERVAKLEGAQQHGR